MEWRQDEGGDGSVGTVVEPNVSNDSFKTDVYYKTIKNAFD